MVAQGAAPGMFFLSAFSKVVLGGSVQQSSHEGSAEDTRVLCTQLSLQRLREEKRTPTSLVVVPKCKEVFCAADALISEQSLLELKKMAVGISSVN